MGRRTRRAGVRLVCALLAVLFCAALLPGRAGAAGDGKPVRVALVRQGGLSSLDANGRRAGYDYEYLQEIAQYTGWNYEFVDVEQTNEAILGAMDQLETGEVDLMTALIYSEDMAEVYDFSAYSYGSVYTVLDVFDNNTALNESNLFQRRELRVAVYEKAATRIHELEQFCAMNSLTVELIPCAKKEEQREAVRTGRADVMLDIDLNLPEDMRAVARFAPRPFYFATGKGNSALIQELNAALLNINEADPNFAVGLYEKYFGGNAAEFYLSPEEQTFIRGAGAVRVAVFPDRMPFQDVDWETGEYLGVTREIFDFITAETGLQFQFVPLHSPDELPELLEGGRVDLVAGMPYDYVTANAYATVMSRPYLTAQTTYALAKGVEAGDLQGKRLALYGGGIYHGTLTDQVRKYDTPRDCLEALERGEADFSFNDNFTMQYYLARERYKNVTLFPQAGSVQKLCIGLGKPVNTTLLAILNKAIRALPENDIQAMIYRNVTAPAKVTFTSFVADNLWPVLGSVLAAAALVIALVVVYFRANIRHTRREALENERYRQLGELTNEHIFEYDYKRDKVSLTARSAATLGVEQTMENYRFRLQQDRSLAAEKERAFVERMTEERAATEELCATMPDGSHRWFRVAAKVVADQQDRPVLAVGRLTDIQKEREELERLAEKARRDSLTGIYNGETTRQLADRRMREHGGGALLVLDVDEFKAVNDRYGHFIGDQALVILAQLLEDTFRRSDLVGRLGGDEFVIFMDRVTDRSLVENKCRQVLEGVSSLPPLADGLRLTVSIGAVMAGEERDYNRLYQQADKALYLVKENSRNGYRLV